MSNKEEDKDLVADKLQRLEELMDGWHQESIEREKKARHWVRAYLSKLCGVVLGVAGGLWSVVEFADFYFEHRALEKMSENYYKAADDNYRETGDVTSAFHLIDKAKELNPNDPDIVYKHVYYKTLFLFQQLQNITRPLTDDEVSKVNMALSDIEILKKQEPKHEDPYYLEALLYYRQGKIAEAEKCLKTALKLAKHPSPEWHVMLLDFAMKQNDSQKIAGVLKMIEKKDANTIWPMMAKGLLAKDNLEPKKAVEYFKHVVDKEPKCIMAWNYLAQVAFWTQPKDLALVRTAASTVIQLAPGRAASAYDLLAQSYSYENKNVLAFSFAEKGIALFPDYLPLVHTKIDAMLQEGMYDVALKDIQEMQRLEPSSLDAVQLVCDLYILQQDYEKTLRALREYVELALLQRDVVALLDCARRILVVGQDYPLGVYCIQRALAIKPNSYAYELLAWTQLRMNQKSQVKETMSKSLAYATSPEARIVVHCSQARLLQTMGEPTQKVWEKLQEAKKLNSESYALYAGLVNYYLYNKDLKKAEECLKIGFQKAKNKKERAYLQWWQALLLNEQKKYAEALKALGDVSKKLDCGLIELKDYQALQTELQQKLKGQKE